MTGKHFGLFMAWLIPLLIMLLGPIQVNDLTIWIVHGEYFLDHGTILREDIYNAIPTLPLVYPTWGVSVLYAIVYRATNLLTVCYLHYAFVMLLIKWVYDRSILRLQNPTNKVARYCTYVFWVAAAPMFGERPSTLALLLLALTYFEIAKINRLEDLTLKTFLKLLILNVCWVNFHGSFILLLAMLGWKSFFILLRDRKILSAKQIATKFVGTNLGVAFSTLINPFTWEVFPFVLETAQKSQYRTLGEWDRTYPWTQFPTGFLFYLLFGFCVYYLFQQRRQGNLLTSLSSPFLLIVVGGLSAIRNASLTFVFFLPYLYQIEFLQKFDTVEESNDPKKRTYLVTAVLFCVFAVFLLPPLKPLIAPLLPPYRREIFDTSVLEKLTKRIEESKKTCAIYNTWDAAGFLTLNLKNKTFLDARNIHYTNKQFLNHFRVALAAPGWERYLERFGACFIIVDRKLEPRLWETLKTHPDWVFVDEEKGAALYTKK